MEILDLIEEQPAPPLPEFDRLLQTIGQISEKKIPSIPADFDGLLQIIYDIREPVSTVPTVPIDLDGLLQSIGQIEEQLVTPVSDLDGLLQTIGHIGEQSTPFVPSGFIVDILDFIEEQPAPVAEEFDGLLQTISDVQEPVSPILPEFDGILQTLADIREQPAPTVSDLDGLLLTIGDIGEQPVPSVESDFIVHILDDIIELPAPTVQSDLDGVLRTIGDVKETLVEKPEFDGLLRTISDVKPYKKVTLPNLFEIICVINNVREKKKFSNLFEIICIINQIRPLASVIPSSDLGFDGLLQMLSTISDAPIGKDLGEVKEGEKVCKVIEYTNQDGEKETLYPFAVIQGHCYYYNKNHDILNENLEIVKNY